MEGENLSMEIVSLLLIKTVVKNARVQGPSHFKFPTTLKWNSPVTVRSRKD